MFLTASQVEKTSKRGGKIISSDQIEQQLEEEFQRSQQEKKSVTELLKNPTKVVCLRVRCILSYHVQAHTFSFFIILLEVPVLMKPCRSYD